MAINTSSNSRFRYTDPINYDGEVTYGLWTKPPFFNDAPYSRYTVSNSLAGRPDLIAHEVYGSAELFWVLISYNAPRETLNWPKANDIILVPDASFVFGQL